jgi:ornithine cyclodeaminase
VTTTPPYLTAAALEGRLDWSRMVAALEEGHRGPAPQLDDMFLGRDGDTLLTRAAMIPGQGAAVKAVTVRPANRGRGLPSVHGAMILFAEADGGVEAVIDSALVTRWKTAADSLLGARLLARPDSRRLLILGAGAVAESLAEAYPALFPGMTVTIWSRRPEAAAALAARVGAQAATDLAAAVREADVVSSATMAVDPILQGAWLVPGQHLDLIGAFRVDMREADDACLRRARIFVDSFGTTLEHIGELRDPIARGVIVRADVLGDLRDLVAGRAGRLSSEEITLFKNGGGAHLDLMTARAILAAWRGD